MRNPIACPFCETVHPWPNDGGALNHARPCSCGAKWALETEPGDFWNVHDRDEVEMLIVANVGEFEGGETPGYVEPLHATFWRPLVLHCNHGDHPGHHHSRHVVVVEVFILIIDHALVPGEDYDPFLVDLVVFTPDDCPTLDVRPEGVYVVDISPPEDGLPDLEPAIGLVFMPRDPQSSHVCTDVRPDRFDPSALDRPYPVAGQG